MMMTIAGPSEVVPRVSLPEILRDALQAVQGGDPQQIPLPVRPPPLPVPG